MAAAMVGALRLGCRVEWLAGMMLCLCFGTVSVASAAPKIEVLSNRADLVSGGDALVEVTSADPATVRMDIDGRDVTGAFAVRPDGRLEGLVNGLSDGANTLTARLPDGAGGRIVILNHPIGGPVFSGPQTQPWLCRTEENDLGPALDAQCNASTKVSYLYKSTDPSKLELQPYDPADPPADVAQTTTDQGRTVPFVVRLERGVIDRGIYEVLVLADPKQPWEPWAPQKAWNGKLYWSFGGDCTENHVQPAPFTNDVDNIAGGGARIVAVLGKGYATAASGMTNLGPDCNSVVSAEATMMIKERVIETLGPIRYTMSEGCSGGSMQQHWIVSDYPGLLDGIQPSCSFPDIWETVQEAEDCHVLDHYFHDTSPQLWAGEPQQEAVTGYAAASVCAYEWDGPDGYAQTWLDPANAAGCSLSAELVYNAQSNRGGVRCTLQDYMVSIFGRRASDGFANYPYDNHGVQYGLVALNSGQISPEQFVDLNEKVGGLDIDWNYQDKRSQADTAAVQTMYRAGLVTFGREAATVPIIDLRGTSNYEIHADFHSYVMRARLQKASGQSDNQIIWSSYPPILPDSTSPTDGTVIATDESISLLDRWLSRIEADRSDLSRAEKVLRNRPADAVDACWISSVRVTDMQKCRAALPYYSDPRLAAGGPATDDVIKCTLKPLDRNDYAVAFTDEQWERLKNAFPDGVCDYSKPGQYQQPSIPWMTFADGPGGRPLGDPPRSVPLPSAQPAQPAACASAAGFRSVAARRARRGLRFRVHRFQGRPFTVDVFQQSAGPRVLSPRLVARFPNRVRPFTWHGRDRRGRRLRDGYYFARFTMRLNGGHKDVRRVALRRVRGRFRRVSGFYRRTDCGEFRAFKLSGPAFGGGARVPLGIAVRLGRGADALRVQARSGGRIVRRWTRRRPRAAHTYRFQLNARRVRTGRRVRIRATMVRAGHTVATQTLSARKL